MIYLLLPVHNRKDITGRFIDCLLKQTYHNYHLLLIDDGSTDGTAEMVKNRVEKVTIIRGNGSWWWAGSLHQGYNWLRSNKIGGDDVVLIMNDDTTFGKDFLAIGVGILSQHSNALLGSQAYSLQDQRLIDSGVHVDWEHFSFMQAQSPEEINCLSTRGLFLYACDFLKLGGFFPRFLPHYSSDYEFTMRAHHKGMKLITDPSLRLNEDENTTGQRIFESKSTTTHIKEVFAKGSVRNPVYATNFILLACPWRWKAKNIFRIWYGIFNGGVKRMLKHR